MNHKGHNRSSSHGRKLAPRSSKPPALHKRGHSHNHIPTLNQSAGHAPRPTFGGARKVLTEVTTQDEEVGDDMAGFLQFCATCEKQIVTPGNSILYCSEACRRRDISMSTPPVERLTRSASSYFDMPPSDIVPQRSPTVVRPASLTFSDLSITDTGSPTQEYQVFGVQRNNERTAYPEHFQSSTARKPQKNRASTAFEHGLPSLSNTPGSSVGTAASWSSYRPLPPRHDPASGHFPTKSLDLVIPTFPTTAPSSPTQTMKDASLKSAASTVTSFRVAEAVDVSFDRRRGSRRSGDQTSDSLKLLLSQDARTTGVNGD